MSNPAEQRQMAPKKEINFISVKRCAVLIGKTQEWLVRFGLKQGKAPPSYFIGGRYLFDEDEVLAWREAQKRP